MFSFIFYFIAEVMDLISRYQNNSPLWYIIKFEINVETGYILPTTYGISCTTVIPYEMDICLFRDINDMIFISKYTADA